MARHYLETSQCPRFMNREKADGRKEYIRRLVEEYKADGVIYNQMKFCEFWSYERVIGVHVLSEEMGVPTIGIEREYTLASAGAASHALSGICGKPRDQEHSGR